MKPRPLVSSNRRQIASRQRHTRAKGDRSHLPGPRTAGHRECAQP
jgi:hypothetical protein